MEVNRGTEHAISRGNGLPVSYLRLLAPPLQLLSAAMWKIVQEGLVDHYGTLEEFVTTVTELVPELMTYSQRAQLVLGLRARLVLELCRGDQPADLQIIQSHLDRIKAPSSTAKDHHVTINQVEESEVNFVELVHTLLEDPSERELFFQEIFPVHFGSKFDTALEMLVWEFISRLEDVLPVPDFTQMVAWLGETPSLLDHCLQSLSPPETMKAVIEHRRSLGNIEEKDSSLLPVDDSILSSLSLPPFSKLMLNSASPSCDLDDLPVLAMEDNADTQIDQTALDRFVGRKVPDRTRCSPRERIRRPASFPSSSDNGFPRRDATLGDLSPSVVSENSQGSVRGGRVLRKRKLSGGSETPSKQPAEAQMFLDCSMDAESSAESPLISIWGEYTDSQEPSCTVVADMKVPWSDEETINLLDIWGKDSVQQVLRGCVKNRHIFALISQKMMERGYMRTVEQCQNRIKRLKKCFRQCVKHNSIKGNPRLECKFYDQLERVLDKEASSSVPETSYDVEEVPDEDEAQESEDCQILSQMSREETRTKSIQWTDLETLALIQIWGEDKMKQELSGVHKNGHIFAAISSKMAAQGFSRTAEQCQTRVKRLKASFRQCYEYNMKGIEQVECKFYDQLEQILMKTSPSLAAAAESNSLDLDSGTGNPTENTSMFSHQDIDMFKEVSVGLQEDRKKVSWKDKETVILLELWGDQMVQQSLRRYPHNGHIYSQIAEKLSASGYNRSPEQCHTRIKRLKASYRQCQENMSLSGSDRIDFKFYDLMEQILEKQHSSTYPTLITESIEISEDSNEGSVNETAEGEVSVASEKAASGLWSDAETLSLIDIWGEEDVQRALKGLVHNGHIYAEIAEKMQDLGYTKTPEQCRSKVKTLRSSFRHCSDRKKLGISRVEYKYYSQLEGILGQESVSLDEYDEKDEHADLDTAGADVTKYAPWTEEETLALIEVWASDDMQQSLKTYPRNGHVFAEIADKLAIMGYLRTAEQCNSRIKRLRKTYKHCCSGQRQGGDPRAFRYYEVLEPILGHDSPFPDTSNTDSCGDSTVHSLLDEEADMYSQASTSQLLAESSRKMPWSDKETQALLTIWGENAVQITLKGCLKNRHVFEYISQRMNVEGFIRTTEQCYTRIKRLKSSYQHDKQEFKFYDQMREILTRELKADGSADDLFIIEEPSVCDNTLDVDQPTANHWVGDNSKTPWGDAETEILLDIWGSDDIQDNLTGGSKSKHIYSQISQAMATQGYLRTAEQCQSRVKRLKANFRQFCEGKKGGGEKQECKFFDRLLQILGKNYLTPENMAEDSLDVIESGS